MKINRGGDPTRSKTISEMAVPEIFESIDRGMAEVSRRLESGERDGSGRFWTDEELAAGAATRGEVRAAKTKAAPAA
jgi:hypothetical protein